EEFVGHRIQLAPETGAPALPPEDAADFGMRGQVLPDALADRVPVLVVGVRRLAGVGVLARGALAARPPLRRARIECDLAGLAREQLLVDVRAARLQPRLRLRRVRELVLDP